MKLNKEGYNKKEIKEIKDIYKKTGYSLVFIPKSKLKEKK